MSKFQAIKMKKEEIFLENFKRALISTIKSPQQKDCEINLVIQIK